jgi:hypothetical protein
LAQACEHPYPISMCGQRRIHIAPDEVEFGTGLKLTNQVHTREDLRVQREVHGRNCRSAER